MQLQFYYETGTQTTVSTTASYDAYSTCDTYNGSTSANTELQTDTSLPPYTPLVFSGYVPPVYEPPVLPEFEPPSTGLNLSILPTPDIITQKYLDKGLINTDGGEIIYTIQITNNGDAAANNVYSIDPLPACMEFIESYTL